MLLRTFEPLYMILGYTNKIQNSVQTANYQEVTSIIFIVTFLFSNCKEYTCSTELYPTPLGFLPLYSPVILTEIVSYYQLV